MKYKVLLHAHGRQQQLGFNPLSHRSAAQSAFSTMKLSVTSMQLVVMTLAVMIQVAVSQDSYNCGGSTLCSGPLITQPQCDEAMRKIMPATRYFTGGSAQETGVCSGHCGLFVGGGSNCDLSGQEMLDAFRELRARECAKCGVKTYNDGCQFKMDYVASC